MDSEKNKAASGQSTILIIGITVISVLVIAYVYYQLETKSTPPIGETTTTEVIADKVRNENPVPAGSHLHAFARDPRLNTFYAGTHNGMYLSTDLLNWTREPTLGNTDVMNFAVNDAAPSQMYVSGHFIGVMRTDDGAKTFTSMNKGLPALDVHVIAADPSDFKKVYAFVVGFGIYRSLDGGSSWAALNQEQEGVSAIAVDPSRAGHLYVGDFNTGLMISSDDGKTFAPSNEGLARPEVTSIVIDRKDPKNVVIGVWEDGVYLSNDEGKSWSRASTDVGSGNIISLFIEPTQSQLIFAGTSEGGLFKSADLGRTWGPILDR